MQAGSTRRIWPNFRAYGYSNSSRGSLLVSTDLPVLFGRIRLDRRRGAVLDGAHGLRGAAGALAERAGGRVIGGSAGIRAERCEAAGGRARAG